jgi:hypothetical protein
MSTKVKVRWSPDLLAVFTGAVFSMKEMIISLNPPLETVKELNLWADDLERVAFPLFGVTITEVSSLVQEARNTQDYTVTQTPQISLVARDALTKLLDNLDDGTDLVKCILNNPNISKDIKEFMYQGGRWLGVVKHGFGRALALEPCLTPDVIKVVDEKWKEWFGFLPLSAEAAAS